MSFEVSLVVLLSLVCHIKNTTGCIAVGGQLNILQIYIIRFSVSIPLALFAAIVLLYILTLMVLNFFLCPS